jgi:Mn2+/Fe2+ NRAMP family transporter
MLSSEIATWFVIFTTGTVLHSNGITTITTADQAAAALEPLVHSFPSAGLLAKVIFATGILGVGLLGVPVLAGAAAYAVAEAFHWQEGLGQTFRQAPGFYLIIGIATLVGMLLHLLHINPRRRAGLLLVYSAIINGVVAVPLLVLILLVAHNRAVMGLHTNGWPTASAS